MNATPTPRQREEHARCEGLANIIAEIDPMRIYPATELSCFQSYTGADLIEGYRLLAERPTLGNDMARFLAGMIAGSRKDAEALAEVRVLPPIGKTHRIAA